MKKLRQFFNKFLELSFTYPKVVISLYVLIFTVGLFFSQKISTIYDIQDTITPEFTSYSALNNLRSDFDRKHNLTIFISKKNQSHFSPSDHCQIKDFFDNLPLNTESIRLQESSYNLKEIKFSGHGYTYKNFIGVDCTADQRINNLNWFESLKITPWKGLLWNPNHEEIVYDIYFQNYSTVDDFKNLQNKIKDFFKYSDFEINVFGTAPFQIQVREGYQLAEYINIIIGLFLILGIKYFFGNWKSGFLLILILSLTTTLIKGFMAILNYPIDFLSHGIFPIMTLATLEDFVFLLHDRQKCGYFKNSFRRLVVPSFFTSLTTFVGFISLDNTELATISRFGLVTAIGAMFEWFIVFSFWPAVEQQFPWFRIGNKGRSFPVNLNLFQIRNWIPNKWITLFSCLVFFTWIPGAKNLVTNDSPTKVFPHDSIFMTSLNKIKTDHKWETQVSVLFENYWDIRKHGDLTEKLKRLPSVVAVENPLDILNFFENQVPNELKELVRHELEDSFFFKKYKSPSGRGQVILYIKDSEINSVRDLTTKISEICKSDCQAANGLVSYSEFDQKVPQSLYSSMITGLILVGLVLSLVAVYTKTKEFWALLLSSLWGPCFIITMLWTTKMYINYTTCIFASVILGLAGDNAIQYMLSRKKKLNQKIESLSGGSLAGGFLLTCVPLAFLLSYFQNVQQLGYFFMFGMLANLFGDLFLLRGLLNLKQKYITNTN